MWWGLKASITHFWLHFHKLFHHIWILHHLHHHLLHHWVHWGICCIWVSWHWSHWHRVWLSCCVLVPVRGGRWHSRLHKFVWSLHWGCLGCREWVACHRSAWRCTKWIVSCWWWSGSKGIICRNWLILWTDRSKNILLRWLCAHVHARKLKLHGLLRYRCSLHLLWWHRLCRYRRLRWSLAKWHTSFLH